MSGRDTSDTVYHALSRPAVGDDWAGSWDDLVATVDTNVAKSGPAGDRPSAGDVPSGAVWRATDQQLIYQSDGSQWTAIAGAGTSSDPLPEQHVETLDAETVETDQTETKSILLEDTSNA
jgi:hypothetical protein